MSGFTKINEDTVEIEHFSCASAIKITFTNKDNEEKIITEQWLSYEQFSNLKKAVNLTDDWL